MMTGASRYSETMEVVEVDEIHGDIYLRVGIGNFKFQCFYWWGDTILYACDDRWNCKDLISTSTIRIWPTMPVHMKGETANSYREFRTKQHSLGTLIDSLSRDNCFQQALNDAAKEQALHFVSTDSEKKIRYQGSPKYPGKRRVRIVEFTNNYEIGTPDYRLADRYPNIFSKAMDKADPIWLNTLQGIVDAYLGAQDLFEDTLYVVCLDHDLDTKITSIGGGWVDFAPGGGADEAHYKWSDVAIAR